jgi:SAM-dependent methyltransferase
LIKMVEEAVSLDEFINLARQAKTHAAKLVVLSRLLEKVFGVKLEDLLPGIEEKIGSTVLGVRGSVDLLCPYVIFEVKVDLERELDDAKKKLRKYFQAMLESRPNERFVGIATDVISYRAFIPVVEEGAVKDVKEVSSIDISKVPVENAILWLDSYIFSKRKVRPTANDLKFRFGTGSPTYSLAVDSLKFLWDLVKDEEDVRLKYELWTKSMEIVYGSEPEVRAFIDQTYLATLVKLLTYLRLSGVNTVTRDEVLKALTGEYFVRYGISNLIEEDFFTWIVHRKILDNSLELVCGIARELLRYDLTQIDEDFFKEIYEEIVERGQRHRVGEYYTPEWLTELILKDVMDLWWSEHREPPRVLDPACGSGTFLCNIIRMLIRELKRKGWRPNEILDFILTNVVGVDINPLAVTIARANYLIALGELLHVRKGPILIPVYVADSIKLPRSVTTLIGGVEVYEYVINNVHLQIPVSVAKDRSKLGKVVSAFKDAIESYRDRGNRVESHKVFERALQEVVTNDELNVLKHTLDSILMLMDKGKDSIWVYMMSNIYIPIALRESKFDIIVGNPPWIIMRYIENKEYQEFVKNIFISYDLLRRDQVHLFTAIEIATAFFYRVADLYLREKGIMGFVMPKSVLTGALHHVEFRNFKSPPMTLHKIFDLEKVSPLFNVPACVLIAFKGGKTTYPVQAKRFIGKLPEKNLRLEEALSRLRVENYSYQPPQVFQEKSPYYESIRAGASIYPRNLFFVEFVVHRALGMDIQRPYCKTSRDAIKDAKRPWKDVIIEGNVEKDFIYATVLSEDIVPFRCAFRPVVLPIRPTRTGYELLDVDRLRSEGYALMANWLERAQKLWEELRTERAKERFPRMVDRLDYGGLLSSQDPNKRYVVLYNTSGTNIASCVVDRQNLPSFCMDDFKITPKGFVTDEVTMFYETKDEMEAHYLCAVLNSDVVNELIKPLQPKGLYGERHIVRRPFTLSIPTFNPNLPLHKRLAELSKTCHDKVAKVTFTKRSIAGKRKEARGVIKTEIEEINELVLKLIST